MLQVDWPSTWNEAFIGQLKETLQNSLQKAMKGSGNKNNQLRGSVIIQELYPGTVSPVISLKHIHSITSQHISFSVVVTYEGDAYMSLKGLEINLDTTTNSNTRKGSKKGNGEGPGLGASSRGNSDNTPRGDVCNNENTTADVNHSLPFFCPFEMKISDIVIGDVIDIEIEIPLVEEVPEYYNNHSQNNVLPLTVLMQSLQLMTDHESFDADVGSHQMETSSTTMLEGSEQTDNPNHNRESQSPCHLTTASLAAFLSTAEVTSERPLTPTGEERPHVKVSKERNYKAVGKPSQVSLPSNERSSTGRTTGLTTNRSITALYNARYGKSSTNTTFATVPNGAISQVFNKPRVLRGCGNGLIGRVRAPNDDELKEGEVKMKVSVIRSSVMGRSSSHSTLSNHNIIINNHGGYSSPGSSCELSALHKTDEVVYRKGHRGQLHNSRKAHDPTLSVFRPYYSGLLNFPVPYWVSAYNHLTGAGSAFDQIVSIGRTRCGSFLELFSFQRFRRVKKGDCHPRVDISDMEKNNGVADKNHQVHNDNLPSGGITIRIQFFSDPLKSFSVDSNFSTVHGANEKIESTLRNLVQPALDKLKQEGLKFHV